MGSELVQVLRHVLGDPLPPGEVADVAAWRSRHRALPDYATPIARAIAGGFAMDRIGYAFASGYVEAMGSLVPSLQGVAAALCATEKGGAHPRTITTRIESEGEHYRVTGEKGFVTLGQHAQELVVVVSEGLDDHDRNRLKMVRLPTEREGLSLEALPPTPFVPEIPHARLTLDGVLVQRDELLPGDGYDDYLKPFRTVEDLHVHAALLGHLVQLGRRFQWSRGLLDEAASLLAAAFPLALADPLDAAVHIGLAGILERTHDLFARALSEPLDDVVRERMQRDRALLGVAKKARDRRLETAWDRLNF